MATSKATVDIHSSDNEILLNPRWPVEEANSLKNLAVKSQQAAELKGHVWLATSGSTAQSVSATKLVALSKQALESSAVAVNLHLESNDRDVWAQVLPVFHVGGLGIEIRAQLSGAKVVPALKEGRWNVEHFYKILGEEGCTLSALVPTQIFDLVQLGLRAPPKLRAVVVGGGIFDSALYERARELGWPVLPSYGMTETSSQIATASIEDLMSSSYPPVKLLSHAQARVSATGLIEVKASSLFTCYAQNNSHENRCWDPKKDGWFTTEDKGLVEQNAVLIYGRHSDYLKIGGEGTNIAHLRRVLERCILELNPSWANSATLIDMPSERLGSEIHLVSQLNEENSRLLSQLFSKKVLPFEKIREIHYLAEIPRTELGKILWEQLRRLL